MNTYKAVKNGTALRTGKPVPEPPASPDPALAEARARHRERIMKEFELDRLRMERMDDEIVKLKRKIEYSEFSALDDPLSAFYDGDEYMEEPSDLPWLVEEFIPRGYLAILGGGSKTGKSCLATALAISIARGEPFLGMPTHQGPVLWFACEESYRERRAALDGWPEIPKSLKTTHHRLRIDGWRDLHYLEQCVKNTGAALVVIDSLFAATDGSLADGRSARDALMGVKRIAAGTQATVLVIHHINKESSAGLNRDRLAESNQILAAASMDLLFDSTFRNGYRDIRLSTRGRGDWANREFHIRSESVAHYEIVAAGDETTSTTEFRAEAIRQALASYGAPLTADEIATLCNSPTGSTRNRLTMMVKEGLLQTAGKRGKALLFALP